MPKYKKWAIPALCVSIYMVIESLLLLAPHEFYLDFFIGIFNTVDDVKSLMMLWASFEGFLIIITVVQIAKIVSREMRYTWFFIVSTCCRTRYILASILAFFPCVRMLASLDIWTDLGEKIIPILLVIFSRIVWISAQVLLERQVKKELCSIDIERFRSANDLMDEDMRGYNYFGKEKRVNRNIDTIHERRVARQEKQDVHKVTPQNIPPVAMKTEETAGSETLSKEDAVELLRKLHELYEMGILNEQEFIDKKAELLNLQKSDM